MEEQYKDTKIGRIPKDWEVDSVKNVCKVVTSGLAFDVFENNKLNEGVKVIFTKVSDMNLVGNERMIIRGVNEGFFSKEFVSSNSVLKPKSIVFPKRGAAIKTNKKRINSTHIILDPNLIAISFKEDSTVDYVFLYHYFLSIDLMSFQDDGVIPQLNKRDIEPFKIPIPPLPEQQKIAEILSTVDEQISTTQAIIDKTKELKKGLMQKLFFQGIGHTEFKDTKIGRIPKDWEIIYLKDLCTLITDGSHYSPVPIKENTEFLIATVKDVYNGILNLEKCVNISEVEFHKLAHNNCVPEFGDVLLSKDGSVGRTCVWDETNNIAILSSLALIKPNLSKIQSDYLKHFLDSPMSQSWLKRLMGGSALQRIILRDIRKLTVCLPKTSEQQKIADILSEADAKIKKEEKEKAQLEQLKKGLMQQLLTGQKRVKI
ncbi:MAG: restriction endonuclease subunit S [Psychroserpens sp.]|uniref:restriction endonuclease subunit S n=1 Tax=Psychroserpens sp. TaxID=2020870 RepID=UPI003003A5B4